MAVEDFSAAATLVKAIALGGLGNFLGGWSPAEGVVLDPYSLLALHAMGLAMLGPCLFLIPQP